MRPATPWASNLTPFEGAGAQVCACFRRCCEFSGHALLALERLSSHFRCRSHPSNLPDTDRFFVYSVAFFLGGGSVDAGFYKECA